MDKKEQPKQEEVEKAEKAAKAKAEFEHACKVRRRDSTMTVNEIWVKSEDFLKILRQHYPELPEDPVKIQLNSYGFGEYSGFSMKWTIESKKETL